MSVLDTFYILFKTDADQAAESMKKVDNAADKTERSLGKADENAKKLANSFLNVAKAFGAGLLAAVSISNVIQGITDRAAGIRELDQFSAKLNASISDVDAFQRAVVGMGGETSRALDSLVKIGEKVNEAFSDKDSGARKDFEAWGLSFKDAEGNALGATDAMLALAGSIEGVSRAEGLARIKRLGIEDAATIELILKGRKEVEAFIQTQKDMGVVTEEQAAITRDYYEALGGLGNQLTSVGNTMVATFLPAMTRGLEILSSLVQWATENQHLVEGFFIGTASAITIWLLPAMVRLGIAVLAATWPFLLMGAAILAIGAAFALAWEDFKAWQEGQPSLLGDLLGDYDAFVTNLQALFDSLNFEKFMKWISDVAAALAPLVTAAGILAGAMGGSVVAPSSPVPTDPTERLEWFKSQQGFQLPEGVTTQKPRMSLPPPAGLQTPAANAGAAFGAGLIRPPGLEAGQSMLNGAAAAPQGLAAPQVTQTNTVTVESVTVQTQATDADGIARAIDGALTKQLRGTAASFDDGVDR